MAPKSILKKRAAPAPATADEVVEVPATVGVAPAREELPVESESDEDGSDEDDEDGDSYGDLSDSDDEDEDAIREMGEDGKPKPKSASYFRPGVPDLSANGNLTLWNRLAELKHTTLRPTPAPNFSLALTHLLSLPPSTSTLAPKNAPPSAVTQRLERRAKKLIRDTKASHLARGHVRDVIAGWGARPLVAFSLWDSKSARQFERAQRAPDAPAQETGAEREKRLRKLAQRGVVRLFNAIAAAQGAPEKEAKEEAKKRKHDGRSDAGSNATNEDGAPPPKILRRPNVLGGRGKGEARTLPFQLGYGERSAHSGSSRSHEPLQGLVPRPHPRWNDRVVVLL